MNKLPQFTPIQVATWFAGQSVAQWKATPLIARGGPSFHMIVEDSSVNGSERFELHRNNLRPQDFGHGDLPELFRLLTEMLVYGSINEDHRYLWSWSARMAAFALPRNPWGEVVRAFDTLVHAVRMQVTKGSPDSNEHAVEVANDRHLISAPLAFAVLEGVLRRKCASHVRSDGTVIQPFTVSYPDRTAQMRPYTWTTNQRANRIRILFLLLGQLGPFPIASAARDALLPCCPGRDVYLEIDALRNDMLHGSKYWAGANAAVLLIISALLLDEIPLITYEATRARLPRIP